MKGRDISDILGYPDDLKLRSSMTLFAAVAEPASVFHAALQQYWGGETDARTLGIILGAHART
jgi:uncharacterized protein (DUF1810 family)